MSAAEPASSRPPAFSPRTILALVIVGLVSFSALVVLAVYAPELRGATDPGAHALSSSAVGFKGAAVMLQAEGVPGGDQPRPAPKRQQTESLIVLTPQVETTAKDLAPFGREPSVLIVLPKWLAQQQPLHPGFVNKAGIIENGSHVSALAAYEPKSEMQHRAGVSRTALYGAPDGYMAGTFLRPAAIDRLQTISGESWVPVLVDDQGAAVLVRSKSHPAVMVLAEPDLLNNQGLAHIETARAGLGILNALRGDGGLRFDVTLNGFSRGRGVDRLMLEPPWLAATLCGVAAALLMGLHGLARFGPTLPRGRAIALGKRALVDNSAGLVRMARREAELAPAYAALTKARIGRIAGGGDRSLAGRDNTLWLAELARQRAAADPDALTAQAEQAKTPDDLLAVGRRLYHWRLEITRERR